MSETPGEETPNVVPPSATTKHVKITAIFPETRDLEPPPSHAKNWIFGALAVLILGGGFAYFFVYPNGETPGALVSEADAPPVIRPYLEKANEGDPSAMRMLGTMYYNGLNVTQDRKAGIRWYRKAAAAGSVAARKDLEQLGLTVDGK